MASTDAAFEGLVRSPLSADLMERLVVATKTRRVHDFLRDFDKLGLKRVVPQQAMRALSACGVTLSRQDIVRFARLLRAALPHPLLNIRPHPPSPIPTQDELTRAYTGADGFFAYELMEADLTDTPLNGTLERAPLTAPAACDPFAKFALSGTVAALPAARMPKAALSSDEEARLAPLVEQAKYLVHTRGIQFAQYVRQYDVTHRGVVTTSRFVREFLSCFKGFKLDEVMLFAKAYGTPDGQVRYMAVHRDVTPAGVGKAIGDGMAHEGSLVVNNFEVSELSSSGRHLEARPGAKKPDSPNAKMARANAERAGEERVDALLRAVIRFVWERRIRIKDIFLDFDKARLNRITRPQFARAVSQLRIEGLQPNAVDALAERYVFEGDASRNVIAYRRFLEDVENAFTLAGLERRPHAVNETLGHAVVSSPPESSLRVELGAGDMALLETALAGTRATITRVKAYNLRAGMRDFDVQSEGFITTDRFLRVLAIYGLVPEQREEREVLLKRYAGCGMRRNAINYRNFLADVGL